MDELNVFLNQSISTLSVLSELPSNFKELLYKHRKIKNLYDWQYRCLELPNVVNSSRNLVYSSPTSGGKTLIAEILLIREVVKHRKSAIFILPFVSIVNEKVASLGPFGVDLQFHVEEYAGSKGTFPPRKRKSRCSIYIATIEKASMLINSFIEEKRTNDIGMVVIDELHMIYENSRRSATLEMLLTKILYCYKNTTIIGMSATLPHNNDCLLKFLKADYFDCKYRPIKLNEYIVNDGKIYKVDSLGDKSWNETLEYVRNLNFYKFDQKIIDKLKWNTELLGLFTLVSEIIPQYSCLVFCPSKNNTQTIANHIATAISYIDTGNIFNEKNHVDRINLIKTIKNTNGGICSILKRTILYGVAYHHSGLTEVERHLIEEAYLNGILNVICCTSTLAAGVNMPARRVILRCPFVANTILSNVSYRQMIGRAGRAGIDNMGESFIIVDRSNSKHLTSIFSLSNLNMSYLGQIDDDHLSSDIIGLVGSKICECEMDINNFYQYTLHYLHLINENKIVELDNFMEKIKKCVKKLLNEQFLISCIRFDGSCCLKTTNIGNGVYQSGISLKILPYVLENIDNARKQLNLESDLYLVYLCMDPDMNFLINDPLELEKIFSKLNEFEQNSLKLLGFTRQYIYSRMTSINSNNNDLSPNVLRSLSNVFIIQQLMQGKSVFEISITFNTNGAYINQLLSSTISFGSMIVRLTKEIPKYWSIHLLINGMVEKLVSLSMCEFLELMTIPRVKLNRAKQLYAKGYKTIFDVANSNPKKLCEDIENLSKIQARIIHKSATLILMERVEALLDEANQVADDSKDNRIITQFYLNQSKDIL